MITVAEIDSARPCPARVCFVRVDGQPLFLCRRAGGLVIPAAAGSEIRAGECSGPSLELVHTGEPWDDVVIDGPVSRLVLTGVLSGGLHSAFG